MAAPSLPDAFIKQMETILGSEMDAFLAAIQEKPPVSLRLNPTKPGAVFEGTSPIPWNPDGYYLSERPRFFLDPLIYAGGFYVQEASSMLIGALPDFSKPLNILDLCAAPGGKSTLLASKMAPGSLLVSNEIVGSRAQILAENVSRWGNPGCVVTRNHPRDFGGVPSFFDLIAVDAPCSGEGMFRKDPDTISHWSPRMVQECASRQREILTAISGSLKPGGRLIYSTCTYNRAENEDIVQWLLDQDPGAWRIIDPKTPDDWGLTPGDTEGYDSTMAFTRHCYLHKVKGEGFFFAYLEKVRPGRLDDTGSSNSPRKNKHKGRQNFREEEKPAPRPLQLTKAMKEEAFTYLNHPKGYELEVLAEDLHAFPTAIAENMRYLSGKLNVLNAGIRIGHGKGKTLVPCHDLPMTTACAPTLPRLELTLEEALHFLKRAEFNPETGDLTGWVLATYKNQELGWMKVLQNRVNNHFPKEMRIRGEIEAGYES